MRRSIPFQICFILFIFIGISFQSCNTSVDDDLNERAKVALREVGNQLLLADKDSTSRVLPVIQTEPFKYQLSFETPLSIAPDSLVQIVDNSFEKIQLPRQYRVEVLQCANKEVAYSYEMSFYEENTIIPCMGRNLPNDCYTIQLRLIENTTADSNKPIVYVSIVGALAFIGFIFYRKPKANEKGVVKETVSYKSIGIYKFYPNQHKLVKQTDEISLSNKECELLEILAEAPNQIVKREELTKRVWEDNGVFVGRSLDTYISKLRKKLSGDEGVQITNVHGVGYKLEVHTI